MKRRIAFFTVLTILVTMASVVLADCGKIIIVRRAPIRVRVVKYRPPIIIVRPSDNTYFGGGLTLERTRTETESNARVETSSRTVTEGYRANANLASNGNVALPTVMENIGGVAGLGIFNEDDQRGVIGWNGKEEILVLSTNEKSTVGDTAMLSVMPLPGKPINITRADKELFNRAKKLVMSKMPGVGEMGVTFKTQIGSHSIFVWEIDDITTFEDMVNGFIAQEYGENFSVSWETKTVEVIKDYFARG
ncbi:MAG: hypothetical protein LBU65_13135, partial [Planctomycetaceae bacterium]|nr:hypothetical protein [Planctomycetaceae bacterium]